MPTTTELYEMYADYRAKYFDYEVPPVNELTIRWDPRLTRIAGLCRVWWGQSPQAKSRRPTNGTYDGFNITKQIITLSTHYHEKFPQDTSSTLLHEMIHLLVPGHGPKFHAWIQRIKEKGGVTTRYCREAAVTEKKWAYICSACGNRYESVRRVRSRSKHARVYFCGKCNGLVTEVQISEES